MIVKLKDSQIFIYCGFLVSFSNLTPDVSRQNIRYFFVNLRIKSKIFRFY